MMDDIPQQTPAPEEKPAPTIDDMISRTNSQAYVFEHGKQKDSLWRWVSKLSRTQKVLLAIGIVMVVATLLLVVFSLSGTNKGNDSALSANTNTSSNGDASSQFIDTNGDGLVDVNDANEESADDPDASSSNSLTNESSTETTWWQRLLNIKNTATSTSNTSTTPSSSSDEYSQVNTSYYDYLSSYQNEGYSDYTSYTQASSGTPLVVATWNVLKYDNGQTNLRNGVNDIFGAGAAIIGLQEISDPSFSPSSVTKLGSGSIGTYSPEGGSAIVWDTKTVDKISVDSFRPIASKEKRFAYGKFRLKSSGQEFYVINQHMQPGVNNMSQGCGSDNCTFYKAQMKTLVAKVKDLQSAKIPIFLIGDFNVDYSIDTCKVTWYPCYALGKIGLTSSYKALGLKSTIGSAKKYIDQEYFWTAKSTDILPVSNKILGANATCKKSNVRDIDGDVVIHCWNGSDHKPLLFTAKLTSN